MNTQELSENVEGGHPPPQQRLGKLAPAFQVLADDTRKLVVFDWSAGCLDCTFDGKKVFQVKKVEELLAKLTEPHKLVCEASFESFIPGRRQAMAELIRSLGHEIYVFRPTATARYRYHHKVEKSNVNDAQVIYKIATETDTHIYPLLPPDPEWTARRVALNRSYFEIKMSKLKPELLIKPAKKILGWYSKLPADQKVMYGNNKMDKYSETLLAAVYFATLNTTSRYEFERVLGLWQSAHPSLLRSDMHQHGYRGVRPRMTMSEYRRAARNLRAVFIAAGVGRPGNGGRWDD